MRAISLDKTYRENSPFYAGLVSQFGMSISYDSAVKICRSHGIDIQQLFTDGDLSKSDIVGGTRVDTIALVMALGY